MRIAPEVETSKRRIDPLFALGHLLGGTITKVGKICLQTPGGALFSCF